LTSAEPSPWFVGTAFTSRRARLCAVCGQLIKLGALAIANHELQQCAHLGCGGIDRRGPR